MLPNLTSDRVKVLVALLFVSSRIFTLIDSEDDTRSWEFLWVYFSNSTTMPFPFKGLEIHTYRLLASQEYARC
jgi:hypothetical protein